MHTMMLARSGILFRAAYSTTLTASRAALSAKAGNQADDDIFDVAIVGAGMVGAAVAALLREFVALLVRARCCVVFLPLAPRQPPS